MAKKKTARKKVKAKSPTRSTAKRPAKPTPRAAFPCYHVDAFTFRPFHGNPAAVVLVRGKWPSDDVMQAVAAETNQPMTAFVQHGKGNRIGLRWFNAMREFDLCGHATLAAAHVLWTHEKLPGRTVTFVTSGGELRVDREKDRIALHLQSRPGVRVRATNALCAALGREPAEVYQGGVTLAVYENKRDVHSLEPDMVKLAALETFGVVVTAPGAGHDFVSRYFAPRHGLSEDQATGSSHCALVPYWSKRLDKRHLTAHQVSRRGGEMWCEFAGDRVIVSGHAVTLMRGTLAV